MVAPRGRVRPRPLTWGAAARWGTAVVAAAALAETAGEEARCVLSRFEPEAVPATGPVEVELVGFNLPEAGPLSVGMFELGTAHGEDALRADGVRSENGLRFLVNGTLAAGRPYGGRVYHAKAAAARPEDLICSLVAHPAVPHDRVVLHSVSVPGASGAPLNVAGKQMLEIAADNLYPAPEDQVVVRLRFVEHLVVGPAGLEQGPLALAQITGEIGASANGSLAVLFESMAIPTPLNWRSACPDPDWPQRDASCVPDIPVKISVSLDAALTFSNEIEALFSYVRPLKAAFLYVGPVDDFGWTYQLNVGRVELEAVFGATVNASTYFEGLPEGEFEALQPNKGRTIASGTPVPEQVFDEAQGRLRPNAYYTALEAMKRLCDEDYDVVFSGSYGFVSQTEDVSAGYLPCRLQGNSSDAGAAPAHNTRFVSIGAERTTPLMDAAFAKIYQMRYLVGMVAGFELQRRDSEPGVSSEPCVGYIAAYPIAEVQRGINAFLLGCREVFPRCTVRVAWTGVWHDAALETEAAKFMWHVGGCPLITQHSDTTEPQQFYRDQGGAGIGYNSDARNTVGDSVLASAIFNWSPVFEYFIDKAMGVPHGRRTPPHAGAGRRSTDPDAGESEHVWLGVDSNAVKIGSFFSPRVPASVQRFILRRKAELEQLKGDEAFHSIFCGDLRKRWVRRQSPCAGHQPIWERLSETEPINRAHYWDAEGNRLAEGNLTRPLLPSDCLAGVDFPGQALLGTPVPKDPSDTLRVFNDFLIDGVELFEPQNTIYGSILQRNASTPCGLADGDRFYSPAVEFPRCDGTQWRLERGACSAASMRSSINYFWAESENGALQQCGTERDAAGRFSIVAELPHVPAGAGPPCDYVAWGSAAAATATTLATLGACFNALVIALLCCFRKHTSVRATQPLLVMLMSSGGVLLCFSTLAFIGPPTPGACVARIWAFNLSFDLVFAFMWSKIYRVRLLFYRAAKMRRVMIRERDMFKNALFIIIIDAVILVLWTALDPPVPMSTRAVPFDLPAPAMGQIDYLECSGSTDIFMTVSLTFKVMLVLSACWLVFISKDIPRHYVEHKFIIFAVYNTAIFSGVVLLLTFTATDDPTTALIIHAVGVSFGVSIVNGSLALPRIALALDALSLPDASEHYPRDLSTVPEDGTAQGGGPPRFRSYTSSFRTTLSRSSSSRWGGESWRADAPARAGSTSLRGFGSSFSRDRSAQAAGGRDSEDDEHVTMDKVLQRVTQQFELVESQPAPRIQRRTSSLLYAMGLSRRGESASHKQDQEHEEDVDPRANVPGPEEQAQKMRRTPHTDFTPRPHPAFYIPPRKREELAAASAAETQAGPASSGAGNSSPSEAAASEGGDGGGGGGGGVGTSPTTAWSIKET